MTHTNKKYNKAYWMRRAHASVKGKFQLSDPHPVLHQLAVSEYEVESMVELSANEVRMLYFKIADAEIDWQKVEDLGVTKVPVMGDRQQYKVKQLQNELGWSDDYMNELALKRYGYLEWKYLTGRPAWAYVNYLIQRRRSKLKRVS